MAKLQELKKYIDFEFSSGCYTGKDYKTFETKYINYLRTMCRNHCWQLVNVGRNHYCFTAFITDGQKFVFFSVSDVRGQNNEWYYHILIRTAMNEKDYHGGQNHYVSLPFLPVKILSLLQ